MKTKFLSILLCLALLISLLPANVLAANAGSTSSDVIWNDGDTVSSNITISGGTVADPTTITVNGTVTMNGSLHISGHVRITGSGKLVRSRSYNGALIEVGNGGALTLDNITISGNDYSGPFKAIVVDAGGKLTINEGAVLSGHKNSGSEGSVIHSSGSVVMNGGVIEKNSVSGYGNIYLDGSSDNHATFTMNGGMIRNNQMTGEGSYGGGAFYVRHATLTINSGMISGHSTNTRGGAIYCTSYGTVYLNGGTITDNTTTKEGDAVFYSSRQGTAAQLFIGGEPYISSSIYLDSYQATKYPYITSSIKQTLTLEVDAYSEGRVIAQGTQEYLLTEADLAKVVLKTLDGTVYYAKLVSEKNQLVMSATDPGYTEYYYISYHGNGGSGSTSDHTAYEAGRSATIKANGFTRSGFTFAGWNTKADGSGEHFAAGQSISVSSDLILFAQWQEGSAAPVYQVTVSANPAEGGSVTGAGSYEEAAPVTVTATAKEGYTFVNWTLDGQVVSTDATFTMGAEEGLHLVANFEEVSTPVPPTICTITVSANPAEGGSVTGAGSYEEAAPVTVTATAKEGYTFVNWTLDGQVVSTDATFTMSAEEGLHLVANFKAIPVEGECPRDESCPMYDYLDLDLSKWYHDGIHYCIEHDLMRGVGSGMFIPEDGTSRAMIVTVLWCLEGRPAVDYDMDFTDVEEDQWYTDAIRWAQSRQVVLGYGDGTFGAKNVATREQMVTILYRYAMYKGHDVSAGEDANILSYKDVSKVATWSLDAVLWACGSDIMTGIELDGALHLQPQGSTTRAQTATLLQRYCQNVIGMD